MPENSGATVSEEDRLTGIIAQDAGFILDDFVSFGDGMDFLSHWTWTGTEEQSGDALTQSQGLFMALPETTELMPSNLDNEQGTGLPPPEPSQYTIHDCEEKALCALNSLHFRKMVQTERPGAPQETTLDNVSSLMPNLDKVLYFNRQAIEVVRDGLSCACAYNSHMSMLYSTIISKARFWYQLSASPNYHLLPPSRSPSGSLRSEIIPGCHSGHQIVEQMTNGKGFKFGVFNLDEAGQKALIRTVVLGELRKVKAIVTTMVDENCNRDRTQWGWYRHISSKLSEEVQATIKKIEDLNRPDESMD
jgi:hypothetical protein